MRSYHRFPAPAEITCNRSSLLLCRWTGNTAHTRTHTHMHRPGRSQQEGLHVRLLLFFRVDSSMDSASVHNAVAAARSRAAEQHLEMCGVRSILAGSSQAATYPVVTCQLSRL